VESYASELVQMLETCQYRILGICFVVQKSIRVGRETVSHGAEDAAVVEMRSCVKLNRYLDHFQFVSLDVARNVCPPL